MIPITAVCVSCKVFKNCDHHLGGHLACNSCYKKRRYVADKQCACCGRPRRLPNWLNDVRVCDGCKATWNKQQHRGRCSRCGRRALLVRELCKMHYSRRWRKQWRTARCIVCSELRPVAPRSYVCERCRKRKASARRIALSTKARRWRGTQAYRKRMRVERIVARGLTEVFGEREELHPDVRVLHHYLCYERRLGSVARWLSKLAPEVRRYVAAVRSSGAFTIAALTELEKFSGGPYLLESCRRAGIVERPRVEWRRVDDLLEAQRSHGPGWAALLVKRYWSFNLRHRVDLRCYRGIRLDTTLEWDRLQLRTAFRFLQQFESPAALKCADQHLVDMWAVAHCWHRCNELRPFVVWLFDNHLVTRQLCVPRGRSTSRQVLSRVQYLSVLQQALTDGNLPLLARVTLLFVALSCKQLTEIVSLQGRHVRALPMGGAEVQFSKGVPQRFEGRAAELILALRAHASPWLFTNAAQGSEPHTGCTLSKYMRGVGIDADLRLLRSEGIHANLQGIEKGDLVRILGLGHHRLSRWTTDSSMEIEPSLLPVDDEHCAPTQLNHASGRRPSVKHDG